MLVFEKHGVCSIRGMEDGDVMCVIHMDNNGCHRPIYYGNINSDHLREIADKLDELNANKADEV